jgi:hypothetical protein
MDPASRAAGLLGLAALITQAAVELRGLCRNYATAKEDVERVSSFKTL